MGCSSSVRRLRACGLEKRLRITHTTNTVLAMILFIRLIPFVVGMIQAVLFWQQWLHPTWYPWVLCIGLAALPIGAIILSWGRIGFRDLMEKIMPTFLLLVALAFALLLVEGTWHVLIVTTIAALASTLSLELFFLMAHYPAAYPVNGISRVNIGYVPMIVWYAVSTSMGLMTFVHSDRTWHVLLCAVLGVLLFRATGHPGATPQQNRVWMIVGVCVGLEVGLLGIFMPVSMAVQGLVASVIFCGVLRMRRYVYDPKPSVRMAWSEALALIIVCLVSLTTAKWL